ncbi:hypothetical protein BDR22DRAFT_860218 [Usnea florida]
MRLPVKEVRNIHHPCIPFRDNNILVVYPFHQNCLPPHIYIQQFQLAQDLYDSATHGQSNSGDCVTTLYGTPRTRSAGIFHLDPHEHGFFLPLLRGRWPIHNQPMERSTGLNCPKYRTTRNAKSPYCPNRAPCAASRPTSGPGIRLRQECGGCWMQRYSGDVGEACPSTS